MEDPHIMQKCTEDCSPNCDEVTYSYEMDTTYLEVDQLCYEGEKTRDVMNLTRYIHKLLELLEISVVLDGLGLVEGNRK